MSKINTTPAPYPYKNIKTGPTAQSIRERESISAATYHIAGLITTVFGLSELPPSANEVAVLWLLHPRLEAQACMAPFASHLISSWNKHSQSQSQGNKSKGLIAVSFDQRNHGTRKTYALANEDWRHNNDRHAQDMFSTITGTAQDTSILLDFLAAYIFPEADITRKITQNLVLGISLGAHAAWQCVMQDPRIDAAIITVGCPDYTRLLSDRARLSKRKTWLDSEGKDFVGSVDFPRGLVEAVARLDPAALIWGSTRTNPGQAKQTRLYNDDDLTTADKERLLPLMTRCFGHKRILNLSGGSDKLVPYAQGEPFLTWLKKVSGQGGWFENGGLYLDDVVIPGVGHECTPEMVRSMVAFVNQTLDAERQSTESAAGGADTNNRRSFSRTSRI